MPAEDIPLIIEEYAQQADDTLYYFYDVCVNAGQYSLAEMVVGETEYYVVDSFEALQFSAGDFTELCMSVHEGVSEALSDTVYEVSDTLSGLFDEMIDDIIESLLSL